MKKSQGLAEATARKLLGLSNLRPKLALILGTGFHHLTAEMDVEKMVSFSRLRGFARPCVRGHAGQALIGRLERIPVLVLSGRAHYYEGVPMSVVTFPVRVLAEYGIRDLFLTNAAGGINPRFGAGDFMILSDHINLMGINPLRGPGAKSSPFVDLSCAYDKALGRLLQRAGKFAGVKLHNGVYLAVSGPSFETPAEIRAFRSLGADAVGMSTIPEVLTARQFGLRVAAVSSITNLAAGLSKTPLSHEEVLAAAGSMKDSAVQLIKQFVRLYAESFS